MTKLTTIAIALTTLAATAHAGDPAKGAPAPPPAKDAKADKAAPPAEMPKPPQELADAAKQMTGTWKCTGNVYMDMKDPTKAMPATGTATIKLDLNNWWLVNTMTGTGKFALKFTSYMTYDAAQKKWMRFGPDNMGGSRMETSAPMKDNKMVWEGEAHSPMGTAKVRETEEMGKDGFHTVGEMSMDGKTWVKSHDVSCKK